mgnify:CR=1 FL=1
MDKKYYVIAGNYREYIEFAKRKTKEYYETGFTGASLSNFIFVDSKERLLGVQNPSGFFIGTWKDHPEIEAIMIALAGAVTNDIGKLTLIKKLWVEMRS